MNFEWSMLLIFFKDENFYLTDAINIERKILNL